MTTLDLPDIAISIRQPWAWAVIYGGKDEYWLASEFLKNHGIDCPPAAELQRGGIIGSVEVTGSISKSDSKWFFGPRALVMRDPKPCAFVPAVGALGYFRWQAAAPSIVPAPARWMLADRPAAADLLGGAS
jgi:hypothetical protein